MAVTTPARGTALVTGATAGIGREFAVQLAARGHDVVLVARDVARLDALAAELRDRHGVAAEVLAADLATREGLDAVAVRVADADRPVDVLVNNAGFGIRGRFVGGDLAEEERMLDLLVRDVLVLSHAGATAMRARGRGHVVNVSSVASFLPGSTYAAAKAYVTTFTRGLAAELAGTGVRATALCPGFVHTEFHDRAGMNPGAVPEVLWLDADRLVRDCLRDMDAGRVVSIPSRRYTAVVTLLRHVPIRLADAVMARRGGRMPTRR